MQMKTRSTMKTPHSSARKVKEKATVKKKTPCLKHKMKENFDIDGYLKKSAKVDVEVEKTEEEEEAFNLMDVTMEHNKKCCIVVGRFVKELGLILDKSGVKKWSAMLVEVENPNFIYETDTAETVPAAFVAGSGNKIQRNSALLMSCYQTGKQGTR